jgi:hypothetical protein
VTNQKENDRRYHASAKGKATRKRYRLGKGKEIKRQAVLKYRHNNRHAESAWNKKKYAKLTPKPCEVCGALPTHAHHDDYSRPLEVRWLCPLHHRQEHRQMK